MVLMLFHTKYQTLIQAGMIIRGRLVLPPMTLLIVEFYSLPHVEIVLKLTGKALLVIQTLIIGIIGVEQMKEIPVQQMQMII